MAGSRVVSLGGGLAKGLAGEVEGFTSFVVDGACGGEGCVSVVVEGVDYTSDRGCLEAALS